MPDPIPHPNAAIVTRLYAGFHDRDLAALADVLSPDVVWRVPGRSVLAGDYRGVTAILGYFDRLHELAGGTFRATPRELVGTASGAIARADTRATREGRHLALDYLMVFGVRDGQIHEAKLYSEDLYAFDAFWGVAAPEPLG